MPHHRTVIGLCSLLLAIVAWGCSSSDDYETNQPAAVSSLEVSSPVFTEIRPRKRIPKESTCYGVNSSPPLDWSEVPVGAKSLALIVEEPDERLSDKSNYFKVTLSGDAVHWVLYNIPPNVTGLPEGVPTTTDVLPDGTVQGVNDFGHIGYSGPCPPLSVVTYEASLSARKTSDSPHEFYFRLYALDELVELTPGATATELTDAMEGHILGYGETMGKFQVPRQQGWFVGDTGTPVSNTPTPMP